MEVSGEAGTAAAPLLPHVLARQPWYLPSPRARLQSPRSYLEVGITHRL
jgi:hypothetical protein